MFVLFAIRSQGRTTPTVPSGGDIDLSTAEITVDVQVVEVGREQIEGPPKTDAGRRTISIPSVLVPVLRSHLDIYVANEESTTRVFVGMKGATPRSSNFNAIWRKTRSQVGRDDLHFHDLRHFANTMAASAGASTKELMARLGHAFPAAALRYQHATRERDRTIADRMDEMIQQPTQRLRAVE